MAERTCSIDGCERKHYARDWCGPHYRRWLDGKPLDVPLKTRHRRYTNEVCKVDDCTYRVRSIGYCEAHYARFLNHGDANHGGPVVRAGRTTEARFWEKVQKTEGCWNWTAATNQYGYPVFRGDGKNYLAHRYSYKLAHGDLPADLQIDHRCHNPLCVKPEHLRAVTNKQNQENLSGPRGASSQIRGVYLNKKTGRWYGQVAHNGVCHNVGTFADLAEAEAAVIAKRNELFTHNDLDREESVA